MRAQIVDEPGDARLPAAGDAGGSAAAADARRTQSAKQDSVEEGVRVAIEAVLMSPNFLFRIEREPDAGATANGPARRSGEAAKAGIALNDYELASRLSYFLWSSMPDDELFRLAEAEAAARPGGARRAGAADAAGSEGRRRSSTNFGEQWLNLRLMDRKKPDAEKFRTVDDELLDAMRQETLLFVGAVMREDRSILDFIDGHFTFVNGPLARYYGIAGVDGEEFQRVELDGDAAQRHRDAGLDPDDLVVRDAHLAGAARQVGARQPAWRAAAAAARRHSGARGEGSRHGGVDAPAAASSIAPIRVARLCHNRWIRSASASRTTTRPARGATKDGNFDIDTSGTLPDGRYVRRRRGPEADSARGRRRSSPEHFTEKLMTYALGRGLERGRTARSSIRSPATLARDNYKFSAAGGQASSNSRPFQMRQALDECRWTYLKGAIGDETLVAATVLRGLGAAVALPFLDAMYPAFAAQAVKKALRRNRMAFLYVPNGIVMEDWTPPGRRGRDAARRAAAHLARAGAVSQRHR